MRLLITTDTVGGVWTYSVDLAEGLLRRLDAVLLVTVGREPDAVQRLWLSRTEARWPGRFITKHLAVPLEWMEDGDDCYAKSEAAMLAVCATFGPDIVHCNQFCYGALPLPQGIPKLVVAHSDVVSWWSARYGNAMPKTTWHKAYVRNVETGLQGATIVVAPTAAYLTTLQHNFSFATASRVLWNGRTSAHASRAEATVFSRKCLQAVSCGRLWDEGKNIRLLESLAAPPLPIVLAGERSEDTTGHSAMKLLNQAAPTGSASQIRYAGPLAPEALASLMGESSIYIVTSRYEPFGLAAVEAALAGCAVLASDLASQHEVWADAAVFFRSDDATDLALALAALANHSEQILAVAKRCRRRALAEFSGEGMVNRYEALYRELIASRPESEARGGYAA